MGNGAGPAGIGSAVTSILPVEQAYTLRQLVGFCQGITGNQEPEFEPMFRFFINLSQRDVEKWLENHVNLQASQQIAVPGGTDVALLFDADFRKERFVRIVEPVNLAHPLSFMEYGQFRANVPEVALQVPGIPLIWYWAPENPNAIHLYPYASQDMTLQVDFIRYAPDMVADGDTPFFDRLYSHILAYQALYYYYNTDGIARPDKGQMWNQMFLEGRAELKKDYQRRQLQSVRVPFGTGVNEGNRDRVTYYGR